MKKEFRGSVIVQMEMKIIKEIIENFLPQEAAAIIKDKIDNHLLIEAGKKATRRAKEYIAADPTTTETIAERARPWVEDIRRYYFNTPEPLFKTQNEALKWIMDNVFLPKGTTFARFEIVIIKSNPDLAEDIQELAKANHWRENETLLHVLTGKTPRVVKYRIFEEIFNYVGPTQTTESLDGKQKAENLLSGKWAVIKIDANSVTQKELQAIYREVRAFFGMTKKKQVSAECMEEMLIIDRHIVKLPRIGKWEELARIVEKETGRPVDRPINLRRRYERNKERMVKRNLANQRKGDK